MDFKEFRAQMIEDLKERMYERTGEEYEVEPNTVAKLQDADYDGIVVRKAGDTIGVNIDATAFSMTTTMERRITMRFLMMLLRCAGSSSSTVAGISS